jgi:choline dehydrogenase-like flavoprotein
MVDGRRGSTAQTYLKAARRRPNLTVETDALATGITLGGNRAQGISYTQGGESHEAVAEREVILAGGAINSPQLLMLSGIGDPDQLGKHGIATRVPLKGVGQNLYDHTSAAIVFKRKGPSSPFREMMRLDRAGMAVTRAYLTGKGFATDLPFGITGFVKSQPSEPIPDLQMLFWMGATQEAKPYLPFTKPFDDRFNVRIMPMRPISKGHLALASADPAKPILIHQGFLETDEEWRQMLTGLRMARELVADGAMAGFAGEEVVPGPGKASDEDLKAHVRKTMTTVHHPVGTAKMGPASDPLAVVDGQLRVHGIEALRVVDASIFPDLIGGATNAPVIMVAEKAADMILGRPSLPPAAI